ncbi:hypothetical protein SRHO_G00189500 [Serrasalmus rhombeus]
MVTNDKTNLGRSAESSSKTPAVRGEAVTCHANVKTARLAGKEPTASITEARLGCLWLASLESLCLLLEELLKGSHSPEMLITCTMKERQVLSANCSSKAGDSGDERVSRPFITSGMKSGLQGSSTRRGSAPLITGLTTTGLDCPFLCGRMNSRGLGSGSMRRAKRDGRPLSLVEGQR